VADVTRPDPTGTSEGHHGQLRVPRTGSDLVTIELLSGFLSLTHPDETGAYVTAGEHMFPIAVRGKPTRALVKDAVAALGYERPDGGCWAVKKVPVPRSARAAIRARSGLAAGTPVPGSRRGGRPGTLIGGSRRGVSG